MTVDLSRVPELMNPAFVPLLRAQQSLIVLRGGANSSKSYSTAQKVVYKMLVEKGHRFLLVRKVKKDVRHSVYEFIKAVIEAWDVANLFKMNDHDSSVQCKINGNDALGVGLDDVSKLKSFFDPTDFWIEEADQASEDDLKQIRLRLRGRRDFPLQGTLTFNPISSSHWIKRALFDRPQRDVLLHHSTYLDNRFNSSQVIEYMQSIDDPYYRRVYVEGEWGQIGGAVFTNFVIEDFDLAEDSLDNVCQGMDFGYTHAQVFIRAGFYDGELYVFDELYARGMVNSEFIKDAQEYFGDNLASMNIVADSANPDKIQEWNDIGYKVEPAKKGGGSVRYGIEYLIGLRIHIHATRCLNLAREMQSFRRKVDRDGTTTERFVEINDDCIAALRYATEWIWADRQASWVDPQYTIESLGL